MLTVTTLFKNCIRQLFKSDFNKAILYSAKPCPEAYRELCKIYTADTRGSKWHCVYRASVTRAKNEDPIIALNTINSCVAELAENGLELDDIS